MRILLFTLLSFSTFAHADMDLSGRAASKFMTALRYAGGVINCEGDVCKIDARVMQCFSKGDTATNRTHECNFKSLDAGGVYTPKHSQSREAKGIYKLLIRWGLQQTCGAGTCGVEASQVYCEVRKEQNAASTYNCKLVP